MSDYILIQGVQGPAGVGPTGPPGPTGTTGPTGPGPLHIYVNGVLQTDEVNLNFIGATGTTITNVTSGGANNLSFSSTGSTGATGPFFESPAGGDPGSLIQPVFPTAGFTVGNGANVAIIDMPNDGTGDFTLYSGINTSGGGGLITIGGAPGSGGQDGAGVTIASGFSSDSSSDGGDILVLATAGINSGNISLTTQDGDTNAGRITLMTGEGGDDGGPILLTTGEGDQIGGYITLLVGASGSGQGQDITLNAGNVLGIGMPGGAIIGVAGYGSQGGSISWTGGAAYATGVGAGDFYGTGGNGIGVNCTGGDALLAGGDNIDLTVRGGNILAVGGQGNSGGSASLEGGTGSGTDKIGGPALVSGGAGHTSGTAIVMAGPCTLTSGIASAATLIGGEGVGVSASGGDAYVQGGVNDDASASGGSVYVYSGTGLTDGNITLFSGNGFIEIYDVTSNHILLNSSGIGIVDNANDYISMNAGDIELTSGVSGANVTLDTAGDASMQATGVGQWYGLNSTGSYFRTTPTGVETYNTAGDELQMDSGVVTLYSTGTFEISDATGNTVASNSIALALGSAAELSLIAGTNWFANAPSGTVDIEAGGTGTFHSGGNMTISDHVGNSFSTGSLGVVIEALSGSGQIELVHNKIGFFNSPPVVLQTGGAAVAGAVYTATEQGMINRMYSALRAYALLS